MVGKKLLIIEDDMDLREGLRFSFEGDGFTARIPNGIMAAVMILNIVIAVIAVSILAKKIVKSNIINEIER